MAMNIIEPILSLQFAVDQGPVLKVHRHNDVVWWHSVLLNAMQSSGPQTNQY